MFNTPGSHIHIVGIGGAGMSAIARILIGRGIQVSGSDRASNEQTAALSALGAICFEGHVVQNITGADVLLISSAVKDDNPEVVAAREAGIPILKRRDALPLLMGNCVQIAVAGTHGKTTTTALVTHILRETSRDPSYIIGGTMISTGDNARAGSGDAFVIEADEYDYMFLGLRPTIAILTNVEHDHPDMFPTKADMIDAFRKFIKQIPPYDGVLIACADDRDALALARERRATGHPMLLYGLNSSDASWRAEYVNASSVRFSGVQEGHAVSKIVDLPPELSGEHNALNALAAITAACTYGVPFEMAVGTLATFKGTGRRFQIMGSARGVTVVSDYGHHPTAIRATLQAARMRYPNASIWAVWQPHTYSRTRLLIDEFAHAFGQADHALVTDIYASREKAGEGDPDGASVAARIAATGHPDARYGGNLDQTADLLIREVDNNDLIVIFSAGDAPRIGTAVLEALR